MSPYFALSRYNGEIDLWCESRGYENGWLKFWVINGHWHGRYKNGKVRVDEMGKEWPGEICWMGTVPFNAEEYSEAMDFIAQLNWRPNMKKTTFNKELEAASILEHNSNVLNLTQAYQNITKELASLTSTMHKLEARRKAIEALASQDVIDTELANKLIRGDKASIDVNMYLANDVLIRND